MSYFGTCLDEMIQRLERKAVDLARISGVDNATISRLRKGDRGGWVSREDAAKLAAAISHDPVEQAELIRARLLDECSGPGSELIRIEIDRAGGSRIAGEALPSYLVKLPLSLEDAFTVIRARVIKDQNVREIVEGLGNLLREGDVRTGEENPRLNSPEASGDNASKIPEIVQRHYGAPKKHAPRRK